MSKLYSMHSTRQNKRVGLFLYYEWLSLAPSLVSTIRVLTEKGYAVDILQLRDETVEAFKPESDAVTFVSIKLGKLNMLTLLNFFSASLWRSLFRRYEFFIGVDHEGIIAAGILGTLKRVPHVYYSLEILTKEDIAGEKGIRKVFLIARKLLEDYFSKRAEVTVVQDKYRAEVLSQDNGIEEARMVFVPNSYYFATPILCNEDSMGVQIPADKKIVIYTGSIMPEMALEEVLEGMHNWPKETFFILHAPYRTPYMKKIEEVIEKNNLQEKVAISIKKLSFEELCCLIRKAHIGISFYRPVDKSFALGPAGKLSFYLSQGKPVVTGTIPSAFDLINIYQCGICVEDPRDAGGAIKTILDRYAEFSQHTKQCYEEALNFSQHFNKVLDRIQS